MSSTSFRKHLGKKLLVASIGVATLTIASCEDTTSGNLIAPPDLGPVYDSGNLLPPPDLGRNDGGESDAGESDAGESDAGATDAGESDAGATDAGESDAGG